ncbi:diaminobutyrate acetyltransferase [Cucumibacter marinus]|uniref:diaminobutyrate acetyltransferase n=1 Tax=Cucumibacter marinus TaxID=1121252 RepID=UPI0003F4D410|nr:diaminobutyrate acetyltransferase [Cucumibacter marinus]
MTSPATVSDLTSAGQPAKAEAELKIRVPEDQDGTAIWDLIQRSGTLDENSIYCNLLQCTHFAETCAVAELDGETVGWVSGYIPPSEPDVLFIWQVCVDEKARGRGLAKKLIHSVLRRKACQKVKRLHSTITEDNEASWALFSSIADGLDTELSRTPHFEDEDHFDGRKPTEFLADIGPFERHVISIRSAA